MKKFCFLFVVLLVSVRMSGQNLINYEGKFTLPESEKYVKLDFDFSETVFEKKYNEKDWNLVVGKEEWEEAKQEALERIVKMMNEKMTGSRIIFVTDEMIESGNYNIVSNYTLFILPVKLNKKGKNYSNFVLKCNATGEVLGTAETAGGGAHFGSLGNMLGDGYENSGPAVAKIIRKHNKDGKKKNTPAYLRNYEND